MSESVVVNPEARLDPRTGDERLSPMRLKALSLFSPSTPLKKSFSFEKYPGATVLRRYRAGETIVRQGAAGWTAFYFLTTDDVRNLRHAQLETARNKLSRLRTTPGAAFKSKDRAGEMATAADRVARLESEMAGLAGAASNRAEVAFARIDVQLDQDRPRGLFAGIAGWLGAGRDRRTTLPASIANDGPADIDTSTMKCPMHEGELFGEMSCLNRAPRSASVIAQRDCYVLEMLRNVLDTLQKNADFKQRMDEQYKNRVLETHVRRLPLFDRLSDGQYERLKAAIELKSFEPGEVIFDEHETSDSLYVIRRGLVKTLLNFPGPLGPSEMPDQKWPLLCRDLAELAAGLPPWKKKVWDAIDAPAQQTIRQAAETGAASDRERTELLAAVNVFIKDPRVAKAFGDKSAAALAALPDDDAILSIEELVWLPEKIADWSGSEVRAFNRLFLELLSPEGFPKRRPRRVLSYSGRGESLGEMGLLLNAPRSATCLAFNHPDNGQASAGRSSHLELVRIRADDFWTILEQSPALRKPLDDLVRERQQNTTRQLRGRAGDEGLSLARDPEFEAQGLVQGQRLMLIDLDRCTRCGDCVRACIQSHADGNSRLYLDGPRFGKYLVPSTCRSCLDPVCMIGCPVGSILRGDNGEIQIRDWCIGCELCAKQCPYGAIQMNALLAGSPVDVRQEVLPFDLDGDAAVVTKAVAQRAVVCDLCSALPSQTPQCVYHCPHDAALRFDARSEFPIE